MSRVERAIFRKGSTTFYWSSMFFPRQIRGDVLKLYSFVRIADDYVDSIPAKKQEFLALRMAYERAVKNEAFDLAHNNQDTADERVIKNIVSVSRKYDFEPSWVPAFLDSMQSDIEDKRYLTMDDLLEYMYGSSEVIGLMMGRIFGVEKPAYESARKLGRAMQFINFIRDISEDAGLGRCYFPASMLEQFDLPDLSRETIRKYPAKYQAFVRSQLGQYGRWQQQAEQGFKYLPPPVRVPVRTASDMYRWTAATIAKDPIAAYDQQIKPHWTKVLSRGVVNFAKELGIKP
jgi:phytoene synthase